MNQANPAELLIAAHQEPIWPSKLSGPCVSVGECVVRLCAHAKMLTRGRQASSSVCLVLCSLSCSSGLRSELDHSHACVFR